MLRASLALTLALTLALAAGVAGAAQISPNPNPAFFGYINVIAGTSDTNAVGFTNNGYINIQHGNTVLAGGELSNLAGATLINNFDASIAAESWNVSQGIYRNYGTTENYGSVSGDIRNESGGVFTNYLSGTGGVNNAGHLTNYGTFSGSNSGSVYNDGVFRNLSNLSGGYFFNSAAGVLRAGDSSLPFPYNIGTISNAGNIDNGVAGQIIVDGNAALLVRGSYASGGSAPTNGVINNRGMINSSGNQANVVIEAGGSIIGDGDFTQTSGTTTLESAAAQGSIVQSEIRIEGGTLTGTGRLESTSVPLFIGATATVAPGFSPGTLEVIGDLDFDGTYIAEIDGPGLHDVIDVTGTVTLGASSILDLVFSYAPAVTDYFDILLADVISGDWGSVSAIFPEPPPPECGEEEEECFIPEALYSSGDYGYDVSIIQDAIGSTDVLRLTITSAPAVVPVPAAVWMFGSALAGLGLLRRRK